MSSTAQIAISLLFFITAFILSQILTRKRIRTAATRILQELSEKQALDVFSAIDPPLARSGFIRMGLRDFRPRALQELLHSGIVGQTGSGKIYLKQHVINGVPAEQSAVKPSERR